MEGKVKSELAVTRSDLEKRRAASSSVVWAVFLTGFKVVVGFATNSLGILAEAAHSGLDLAAALMTLIAVRVSGRPADQNHLYGHGKVENLSALFETLLLAATCVWIISGAIERLISGKAEVEVNIWSFSVMITSIVVDVSRSRMLYRVARKYNSQALEADALHFSTDIWSSAVVILGLFCVKLGEWFGALKGFLNADSLAAILVALIVIQVSYKLGMRTVHSLLDTAPVGFEGKVIAAVEALTGVKNCHNVRARYSGSQLFVDVHVLVDGSQTLKEAHDLTDRVETAIQALESNVDVTVHAEPHSEIKAQGS